MTVVDLTKHSAAAGEPDEPDAQVGEVAARPPTPLVHATPLSVVLGGRERPEVDTSIPLRPTWARDRVTFTSTARNFARRNAYRAARWALHLPVIMCLLVLYSPRGTARVIRRVARYLYDQDSATVRSTHAERVETGDYVKTHNVRRANLQARWLVAVSLTMVLLVPALAWTFPRLLSGLMGALTGAWLIKAIPGRGLQEVIAGAVVAVGVWWFLPAGLVLIPRPPLWALLVLATATVLALGWVGRPQGKRLVKSSTLQAGVVEPLRAPIVIGALCSLGNSKMTLKTEENPATAVRLLSDPHRHGPGVQLDLELPPGVPATFVGQRREEFAAALRRELGTVWPSVGVRHPGHLALFVSDQPMSRAPQRPWPLMKTGEVDLFRPFPAFTDQRGQWVEITLAYANMIIGAVPRMGKTFVVRELLLCAGLDKRAKVYAIDGKGTGDLAPCSLFAHFYSVGDEPEEIERVLTALRELRQEMRRRTRIIREMSREDAPENKVTSALAGRKGLEPIVIGVDETQVYFEDADKAIREELRSLFTDLVKRGPALGIVVILATQTVNKDTIPTGISNNAVIRFCLKMEGYEPNDRVLGTGAYKRGIDAQMFDIDDKGIGYLKSDGTVPRITRSVYGLDAPTSERIARRCRQLRIDAGRLSGDAAGESEQVFEPNLLDDVAGVFDQHRALLLGEIVDGLKLLRPNIWGHLDNPALGSLLNMAGVRRGTIYSPVSKGEGYGVKRVDLDAAAVRTGGAETAGDDLSGARDT